MTQAEINALKLGAPSDDLSTGEIVRYTVVGWSGDLRAVVVRGIFDRTKWHFTTQGVQRPGTFPNEHKALAGLKEWLRANELTPG